MMRVVLDANVVISGIIRPLGSSAAILQAWRADYFQVLTCRALLAEIEEKLRLPRIRDKYRIDEKEIASLLVRFLQSAFDVPGLAPVIPPPPDPDDAMLFASATEADADYIVTGDKKLLTFTWQGRAQVVSPRQFWEDLPSQLVRHLRYPVFVFEDLTSSGYCSVETESGRVCLALFTTQQAAEFYRRQNNVLVELQPIQDSKQLTMYLGHVSASGCDSVAFNRIEGQLCIVEFIAPLIKALEQNTAPAD